ncbi:MAG TPA: hypothetical protein DC054_11110 [Blastocatellia bacterium]|nr:hypothetical protein [Blastocatellia bacterium]
MELEERLTRLEADIAKDRTFERFELTALRVFQIFLGTFALLAAGVWAVSEFAGFVIERYSVIKHALGW